MGEKGSSDILSAVQIVSCSLLRSDLISDSNQTIREVQRTEAAPAAETNWNVYSVLMMWNLMRSAVKTQLSHKIWTAVMPYTAYEDHMFQICVFIIVFHSLISNGLTWMLQHSLTCLKNFQDFQDKNTFQVLSLVFGHSITRYDRIKIHKEILQDS